MNASPTQAQHIVPTQAGADAVSTQERCSQIGDVSALRGRTAFALQLIDALQAAWRTLRQLAGDDAFERYCEHLRLNHPDELPLSRREFYIRNQQEKWSGIKRCC
jgi:uncharacterized short protein YbdD (DUF466 family)